MPRKIVTIDSVSYYHITARCINREWFRIPLPDVWTIMCNYLFFLHHAFGFEIYCFVLMDNHIHFIVRCPLGNMSEGMNYFMRETSRVISQFSGRINQVYGGPYHKSRIDSYHYFLHAYKYVYRNPVEAKLVDKAEAYQFSTLNGLIGQSPLIIPVEEDLVLFENIDAKLKWINHEYKDSDKEMIRKALRKSIFEISKDPDTNRPHRLNYELS